jgi:hypothetical protein
MERVDVIFWLMVYDRYFLYNMKGEIGIYNLTGRVSHGIVNLLVSYGGRNMTDNKDSGQRLKLTSLSHGAG